MTLAEKAILRTIIYSDIFDYPLTKEEVWKYLITEQRINRSLFDKIIKDFKEKDGFYFLRNKERSVILRKRREKISKEKLTIARFVSYILSYIPTIQLIGVSGGLAMENADQKDDIDLFIVCKKNTVWTTRLLVLFFLQLLGKRRRRDDKNVANKICSNMIIDESSLDVSKGLGKDLYIAHEVVQVKPIVNKNAMFEKFLAMNKWVSKYLPNSFDTRILRYYDTKRKNKAPTVLLSQYLNIVELFSKRLQVERIKSHQTTEVVEDNVLAFHPFDYRHKILKEYNKRIQRYEI